MSKKNSKTTDESPRINVSFDPESYEHIKLLAAKQKKSMAEVVRNWALQGLNGDLNAQNIGLITDIVRTQLQDVLRPSIDRLATLNAKTCIQAGTAAYIGAEAILRFVPTSRQQEVELSYELARKKSIAYMKGKINEDE
ncbi:hypothetical protein [Clostridium sp. 3-3]|uniref:hypothetical protein n=1 Tax=Clostridium sp. 3-3 TaxID=2070757 RepID=UPI000CDB1F44|nr:hypothetical protein [Clostridium sp. 3-3]POO87273.1 hypothetical protein C1H59_06530 [Clostridium sp. 3-3]